MSFPALFDLSTAGELVPFVSPDDRREARKAAVRAEVLLCLRDAKPDTLEMLALAGDYVQPRTRGRGWAGGWTYRVRPRGFDCSRTAGPSVGVNYVITWPEVHELVESWPAWAEVDAWRRSLTNVDAWRDLGRPFELWPKPERWHPSYVDDDRARAGYAERLRIWRLVLDLLTTERERQLARVQDIAA